MKELRATNSPDQREKLLTKFMFKFDGKAGSVLGRGESRLGVISETESYT